MPDRELWKDVIGYEGLYQISNAGRVKSLDRVIVYSTGKKVSAKGKILVTRIRKDDGYVVACLCKNQKEETAYLHRLVAIAFLENPEEKPEVNHKKGIKTNNSVEDLEWATTSENNKHAHRIGLNSSLKGEDSNFAKLTQAKVLEIRRIYNDKMATKKELSAMFNVTLNNIYYIVSNRSWKNISQ